MIFFPDLEDLYSSATNYLFATGWMWHVEALRLPVGLKSTCLFMNSGSFLNCASSILRSRFWKVDAFLRDFLRRKLFCKILTRS